MALAHFGDFGSVSANLAGDPIIPFTAGFYHMVKSVRPTKFVDIHGYSHKKSQICADYLRQKTRLENIL
jgi:hypothetical protein